MRSPTKLTFVTPAFEKRVGNGAWGVVGMAVLYLLALLRGVPPVDWEMWLALGAWPIALNFALWIDDRADKEARRLEEFKKFVAGWKKSFEGTLQNLKDEIDAACPPDAPGSGVGRPESAWSLVIVSFEDKSESPSLGHDSTGNVNDLYDALQPKATKWNSAKRKGPLEILKAHTCIARPITPIAACSGKSISCWLLCISKGQRFKEMDNTAVVRCMSPVQKQLESFSYWQLILNQKPDKPAFGETQLLAGV